MMRSQVAENVAETIEEKVSECRERIKSHIYWTPLLRSVWLSDNASNTSVYLKLESEQCTGSFKFRGALNEIKLLKSNFGDKKNVVTASSGNHGMACTVAMQMCGIIGSIFVNKSASKSKIDNIERLGGKVVLVSGSNDCHVAEMRAKEFAQENDNYVYISPYTGVGVVAGAGTIGFEIFHDLCDVDVIFVTVGGGGLISGIAAYIKKKKPSVKIIGCQAQNSCVMFESVKEGKVLDLPSQPTLSDGSAGGVDPDSFTFDICCTLVDEWVLVSEDEISRAMFFMLDKHNKLIEGAAACTIAAYSKRKSCFTGLNVVLVICGSNVENKSIKEVIDNNYKE